MRYPVIMHINYCEQGQTVPDLCRKAAAWGFDGVEFRRKRQNVEESTEAYLDAIEQGVKKSGLKHVLFGYPCLDMNVPDPAARKKQVRDAIAFYRHVAKRFKVTTINAFCSSIRNPDSKIPYQDYEKHGSFIATEQQWAWAVEGFQALADGCKDIGVRFAFETHMVYLHDTVAATMKLVDRIDRPAVGVNLDYGNLVNFSGNPALKDTIAQCGKRLFYVHLKNSIRLLDGERVATALSGGTINNREFVQLLMDTGFDGPICVEAPRGGNREWYAQEDLAYVRSVLADLQKPLARRASKPAPRSKRK